MGFLLDTCVVLWWLDEPNLIQADTRAAIADPGSETWVSSTSVWEIAIKAAKGRLRMPMPFDEYLIDAGLRPLEVSWDHAMAVRDLEPHHNDPFDRMLIAQARVEGLTLVTRDPWIQRYDVSLMTA